MQRRARATRTLVVASIAGVCLLLVRESSLLGVGASRSAVEPARIAFRPSHDALESLLLEAPENVPSSDTAREPLASQAARTLADDVTILHVHVLDSSRAAVTEGSLECYAGEFSFPESQEDGLHFSTRILGETTDVVLSSSCSEAVLIACGAGGPATVQRSECLRGAGPDRKPTGLVEHDVTIVLERDPSIRLVHGSIDVDGERRVPDGLRILLQYDSSVQSATLEELLLRQPQLAAIDPRQATYSVGPLTEWATALWVTSDETVPCWTTIPRSPSVQDVGLDLHCEAGRILHLTCIDERSGLPARGACIGTETLVATSITERRVTSRAYTSVRSADANGECLIRGLPSEGIFRITGCPTEAVNRESQGSQIRMGGDILLELELDPELPREIWREVRILSTTADLARVWGARSNLDVFSEPALVVRFAPLETLDERSSVHDAALSTAVWEAHVRGPEDYAFWVESEGRRVSEIEKLWISGSSDVGPLAFAPRHSCSGSLVWTDAPVGSRMTLAVLSTQGAEQLADVTLSDRNGELELAVDRACELNVSLHGPGGDEVQRQFAWNPEHLPVLEVDLCGCRARRIRLDVRCEPLHGASEMLLFGLHDRAGERPVRALLTLHEGLSTESVPLPPGEYYYRLLGSGGACVAGLLQIGALEGSPECTITWRGHRRDLENTPRGGSGSLVVESIDGRELSASIPEGLRTFSISTLEGSEAAPPLCPEAFTYRVYGR